MVLMCFPSCIETKTASDTTQFFYLILELHEITVNVFCNVDFCHVVMFLIFSVLLLIEVVIYCVIADKQYGKAAHVMLSMLDPASLSGWLHSNFCCVLAYRSVKTWRKIDITSWSCRGKPDA